MEDDWIQTFAYVFLFIFVSLWAINMNIVTFRLTGKGWWEFESDRTIVNGFGTNKLNRKTVVQDGLTGLYEDRYIGIINGKEVSIIQGQGGIGK